ncbi:hypothetical protein MYSTI_02479 [Myxococcus stipitatus DSM 14675]|uniref:Uncharacterized protein n=1 Tax=Myxococcus stipitatus (strain DSM 14675 / JCM 12634 / Mx s8) TaxID=1278073 RepID=L7U7H7_MYXSD|nr:hypothetical protein [Myxococcus stipitatus]AGC43795.1 hypothetical protein MYSTI_02479 [Myxococcus stipitatus DSM 14675]
MALPPHEYARSALDAELHVQVAVDHVELPPVTPGEAVVTGRIARVFRGAPSLHATPVSFTVEVCRDGDDVDPGGTLWTDPARLAEASVIEVFLARHGEGFRNASYDTTLLTAPTDSPTIAYTEEMAQDPDDSPTEGPRRMLLVGIAMAIGLVVLGWVLVG